MRDYDLYVILDREVLIDYNLVDIAKGLISQGVNIIQYRDKVSLKKQIIFNAEKLKKIEIQTFLINDYVDIAKELDLDGVHLGQDDLSIKETKHILDENKIIGKSTHSIHQAIEAQKNGASYIGIGPVFRTNTKKDMIPIGLDTVKEVVQNIKIPAVAIGGINLDNIEKVLATGITRMAVCSAIFDSGKIRAKAFIDKIKNNIYW